MWTGLPFGAAASLVSLGFGGAAMCLIYRMLAPRLGGYGAAMSVLALCVGPAAVIWQAAYTESLALFAVVGALYALSARRYGWYLAAALVLALTRPIALPLTAVVAAHTYLRWRRRRTDPFPLREQVLACGAGLLTAASFLIWPVVAALVTRRPDAYFVTQRAWLQGDTSGWPSWFLVVADGSTPALRILVPAVCAALLVVLLRRPAARWGPELRGWALLYPLYLLGATTPTTSIFRYSMLSVVPWWPFPEVGDAIRSRRDRWALVLLVSMLGLAAQVAWMRWFFVVGPHALERP